MGAGAAVRRGPWLAALLIGVFGSVDAGAKRFPRGKGKRYHRNRVTDTRHVALDIRVDLAKGSVAGSSTITMALLRPSKTILLDAGDMTVESITVDGARAVFKHTRTSLKVTLPKPPAPGTAFAVRVKYKANPKRGLYFVRPEKAYPKRTWQAWSQGEAIDNRYWFPSYDFPDDRFTTEMKVTVRKPLVAVSNGRLISTTDAGKGWHTYHWKMAREHVNYLVTLVIGEFQRFDAGGGKSRVPLPVYVTRRDAPHWKRSFSRTADMMVWLEKLTGEPYPWEKYAQVVVDDFLFGGMENTSATTLTNSTIHDARAGLDFTSDGLVLHELAHQWFGDLITCRSWAHLWLNEGFATYLEMVWIGDTRGRDSELHERVTESSWYLHEGYRRPMDEYGYEHADDMFDGHTYIKGAWILHMLRVRLGDALWRRAVRRYVRKHRGTVVETDDLRRAFEEVSGDQLKSFFDQWVHGKGHPEFNVSSRWDAQSKQLMFTVEQKKGRVFDVRVPLVAAGKFGLKRWTVRVNRRRQEITLPLPSEPSFVEFDPEMTILSEVEMDLPAWQLIAKLAGGTTVLSRKRAADDLAALTGLSNKRKAVAALTAVLREAKGFHWVRAAAAAALGELATEKARAALVGAVRDLDPRVRKAVVKALGNFEEADARAAIRHAFEKDKSYRVAAAAVTAYNDTGASDARKLAARGLKRSSHRELIRKASLSVLADGSGKKAFDRVLAMTRWGQPTSVRQRATTLLGRIGRKGKEFRKAARHRLERLIVDRRLWVQDAALKALKKLGDPAAIAALKRYKRTAATRRLRRAASEAIGALSRQSNPVTPKPTDKKVEKALDALQKKADGLEKRLRQLEDR